MKKLNREDLSDILYGCAILGTGGGGDIKEGFQYIDEALDAGKEFKLISIDDVPAGENLCTPYLLGAISPLSAEEEKKYSYLKKSNELPMMTAFKRLKAYSGQNYYGTICCELGGANTAISFYLAAMTDSYIIDADPAGRAVPEITHSTYYFNDLPAAPIVAANEFGECFICENIIDDMRSETVVRALSKVSRNNISAIDHALPVEVLKGAVIEGTISKALTIGKAFRIAKEKNTDLAEVIAEHGGGYVAFTGTVSDFNFETTEGFTLGNIHIAGGDGHQGNTYHISVKNENMMSRLNGEVDVTIPDLICCIDLDKGEPISNPHYTLGMNVAVIILPAAKEFTTSRGLQAFGPAYVGLDTPYRPAISNIK
ncbi:DUF917 domain-containing protein [Colwellia sp. MB02u-10]|uniref:DUF917 domain-containing protein n=1 Tax=Colwellia sp. MB02u-10 TaxID=2759828 RepID=UPI0015F35387|nr:DUF917 domain-containing protein [Colwellia sp. MB02u-10]MBA6340442.1 DUF917 domain-containing protein [Colwellia sp. MB02u-10]